MGEFEEQKNSAEKLVNAILKDLEEEQQEFPASEKAVDWLNNSILPYKLLNTSELTPEIKKLLAQIEQNKGKKLSEFTGEELKDLAETEEGRRLKRLILKQKYPLKTLKSQRFLSLIKETLTVSSYFFHFCKRGYTHEIINCETYDVD